MFKYLLCAFFLMTISAYAADIDVKDMQWNRYAVDEFSILSIDNSQGKWLADNIQLMKTWTLRRWGFPDSAFHRECRVFCVHDKKLMKQLFNIESSKIEIRKDVNVMWLLIENNSDKNILPFLSQIMLSEYEAKEDVTLGFWFKQGAGQLCKSKSDIRQSILLLYAMIKKDEHIFQSQKIFSMTEDEYKKLSFDDKVLFDNQSMMACLMLRKEFGEAKLQGFLRLSGKNGSEEMMRMIYGFSGCNHFDKQYIHFMSDLSSDVLVNRTPDSYLEVNPR